MSLKEQRKIDTAQPLHGAESPASRQYNPILKHNVVLLVHHIPALHSGRVVYIKPAISCSGEPRQVQS